MDTPGPTEPEPQSRAWRWIRWVLVGVAAAVILVYGAVFIYARFINDPQDALTLEDLASAITDPPATTTIGTGTGTEPDVTVDPAPATTTTATTSTTTTIPNAATASPVEGTWHATEASELGYRVAEVLFGVNTEGVGRTNQITGILTIEDTIVTDARFDVDVATIISDDSRRDDQFRDTIMSVEEYPTATFVLTEPIDLGRIPEEGEPFTTMAQGELTLRGITNPVTFELTAQRSADRIGVFGTIPVVFADYELPIPSLPAVTIEDNGLLEFVLVFEREP